MTRRPFNPNEAELPRDLEPTVADLERYLADSASDPAPDFSDRVMREVATQPAPRRGLWAVVAGTWAGDRGRMALLAATVAAAVLAVVIFGQLPRLLPSNLGGSPSPTIEPSPTFTVSPQPTEPATQSEEPSPSPSESESPDASDDEDRTPSASPSGSDDHGGSGSNSGPGGGGSSPEASDDSGGNSGPGGGSGSDD